LAPGKAEPEEHEQDEDDLKDAKIAEIRKRYAALDASGDDYIVDDPSVAPEERSS
jgi:hypothetical protein